MSLFNGWHWQQTKQQKLTNNVILRNYKIVDKVWLFGCKIAYSLSVVRLRTLKWLRRRLQLPERQKLQLRHIEYGLKAHSKLHLGKLHQASKRLACADLARMGCRSAQSHISGGECEHPEHPCRRKSTPEPQRSCRWTRACIVPSWTLDRTVNLFQPRASRPHSTLACGLCARMRHRRSLGTRV